MNSRFWLVGWVLLAMTAGCHKEAATVSDYDNLRAKTEELAVRNNLHMLAVAANQFYLEKGADSATYDDLVGPGKYINEVTPVAGEDYHSLSFKQGQPLRVRTRDGRVIEYRI